MPVETPLKHQVGEYLTARRVEKSGMHDASIVPSAPKTSRAERAIQRTMSFTVGIPLVQSFVYLCIAGRTCYLAVFKKVQRKSQRGKVKKDKAAAKAQAAAAAKPPPSSK